LLAFTIIGEYKMQEYQLEKNKQRKEELTAISKEISKSLLNRNINVCEAEWVLEQVRTDIRHTNIQKFIYPESV
jgi:hypothetical protein